jgi:hypothetical protein
MEIKPNWTPLLRLASLAGAVRALMQKPLRSGKETSASSSF